MNIDFGKILIILGIVLVIFGLLFVLKVQIPWLGKLPGDIYIKRGDFQFYFPIVTCILISIILTLLFYFLRK